MADSFGAGMELGQRAVLAGVEGSQSRERLARERERVGLEKQRVGFEGERLEIERKKQIEDAADRELERKRGELTRQGLEEDVKLKQAEALRFIQADAAYNEFEKAYKEIDWSRPGAGDVYGALVSKHINAMARHPSITKKYEAVDKVTKDSQKYVTAANVKNAVAAAMEKAGQIAPDLLLAYNQLPPEQQNPVIFAQQLREREIELQKHQVRLREAYGRGRSVARPVMPEADKAEMASLSRTLMEVEKQIFEFQQKRNPADTSEEGGAKADRLRNMMMQRDSLRKRMQGIQTRGTPAGGGTGVAAAPAAAASTDPADDPLGVFGDELEEEPAMP